MNTVSMVCEICRNPNIICKCNSNWVIFDSLISKNCKGHIKDNVKYSDISISTMTVCFNFNKPILLDKLREKLMGLLSINYKPGSKKSKVPKKKGTDSFYNSFDIKIGITDYFKEPKVFSNVSIFIFPNGKVKVAGAKTINTINILTDELIELIGNDYVDSDSVELIAENITIHMICSDFKIKPVVKDPDGWCIKQEILKNILVKEYSLSATFSALSRYPGINLKVPSIIDNTKNISLLIFRSGSIIITGAKNAKDIANCYQFITNIICSNAEQLFYHDINEELKQKKKKREKKKEKLSN